MEASRPPDSGDRTSPAQRRPGPLRVLVVEDTPINQAAAVAVLEQAGHRVGVAEDGAEALEALAAFTFDVVLMDLHMPGLDGFETTRRIRALDGPIARIPIIAVTATARPEDYPQCLEAGMNEVLAKPFTPEALAAAFERVLPGALP
jgi:CheY-like chemotaxis protein